MFSWQEDVKEGAKVKDAKEGEVTKKVLYSLDHFIWGMWITPNPQLLETSFPLSSLFWYYGRWNSVNEFQLPTPAQSKSSSGSTCINKQSMVRLSNWD